jgi:hypothetical protein
MKEYEKLAEEFMMPAKSYIDPKSEGVGLDAFIAGFLKCREMAIRNHMHSTDHTPLHDLLTLGEKEV